MELNKFRIAVAFNNPNSISSHLCKNMYFFHHHMVTEIQHGTIKRKFTTEMHNMYFVLSSIIKQK